MWLGGRKCRRDQIKNKPKWLIAYFAVMRRISDKKVAVISELAAIMTKPTHKRKKRFQTISKPSYHYYFN
jgi:hypothetical protein